MPYKDYQKQLAYQRKRKAKKRKLFQRYKRMRGCDKCGYNKCPAALEFHHPNKNKNMKIQNLMRIPFHKVLEEVKKCILLCANCHREKHYINYGPLLGNRAKIAKCGTLGGYKVCGPPKCELCRKIKRDYMRNYMRKLK